MADTMSKAFREFAYKKCEEIIANDEHCIKLDREILRLERELLPLLSREALSKFLKIDELSMELTNRIRDICTDNFTTIR